MTTLPHWLARLLLLLALAAAITTVIFKQSAVSRLRGEQQSLLSERQEALQLIQENSGIAALGEANKELDKLRDQNKELPKLRNDVRQLRRQAEELEKLRAENQRLQDGIRAVNNRPVTVTRPANFFPRAALRDVGSGSPEATAQTFFWAMTQGNIERLAQLSVDPPAVPGNAENVEAERRRLAEESGGFPGFSIVGKQIISTDEVVISIQTSVGGTIVPMKFKLVDGEWKFDQH